MPDLRDSDCNKDRDSDRMRRHTDRQLDVYRRVWKDDQWIKDHYGHTGSTASDDSTGPDHHSLWSDTCVIDTNLY